MSEILYICPAVDRCDSQCDHGKPHYTDDYDDQCIHKICDRFNESRLTEFHEHIYCVPYEDANGQLRLF